MKTALGRRIHQRPGVRKVECRPSCYAPEAGGADALTTGGVPAVLPEGILHDDEVVILMLRPSVLFIPLSCITSLVFIAMIAFGLAYAASQPWIGWTDTQAFALGAGLMALRLSWQALEWYCRVYVLTDRRIIRRMGVLRIAVFETRLKNIQHTAVFTQFRERICGLGTIGFATSGTDVIEAMWVMIRKPFEVHKTVVETIRRYGG